MTNDSGVFLTTPESSEEAEELDWHRAVGLHDAGAVGRWTEASFAVVSTPF
jgi:hypothetical protein